VKFLESTKLGVVSKKKVLRKSSQKTKQELVDEMNQLQKNLKETQQKIKTIQVSQVHSIFHLSLCFEL
jgi:predicted nuclease with TOPRIM domain